MCGWVVVVVVVVVEGGRRRRGREGRGEEGGEGVGWRRWEHDMIVDWMMDDVMTEAGLDTL
jgi:hypothetical protein